MAALSRYSGMYLARRADVAGAASEGFRTTAFPADMAPIMGSKESAVEIRQPRQINKHQCYRRIILSSALTDGEIPGRKYENKAQRLGLYFRG
ncbi:hypothetical protein ACLOJK_020961 [Asimina triloba]